MMPNYLRCIYVLLVLSYIFDQVNQAYRLNWFNYKKIVGMHLQNLIEFLLEFSLSIFSLYILLTFDIKQILLRFFLILFSIFYSLNGILSLLLMFNQNNNKIFNINEDVFYAEFLFTKMFVIALFYIIYSIFF